MSSISTRPTKDASLSEKQTDFSRSITERQYLHKDREGNVTEDVDDMVSRVAYHIARAEAIDKYKKEHGEYPDWYKEFESRRDYVTDTEKLDGWIEENGYTYTVEEWAQPFHNLIASKRFIPAGRILQGSDSNHGNALNCFVLGASGSIIDAAKGDTDSIAGIYELAYKMAEVTKRGGGCGVYLGNLRECGSSVRGSSGESSGPISFLRLLYATTLRVIKLAGVRRGAGMATLDIDHPDILDFITAKDHDREEVEGKIESFNISALVTDDFMQSVEDDGYVFFESVLTGEHVPPSDVQGKYHYPGQEPTSVTGHPDDEPTSKEIPLYFLNDGIEGVEDVSSYEGKHGSFCVKARWLWGEIADHAHRTGDPGVIFIDRVNSFWPMEDALGPIKATNPCQPSWAPVLTSEGIRTMGEISTGDIVWSGDKWTEVVQKIRTGVKEVYEYHTTAGRFYGTNDHRVVQDGQKVEVGGAEAVDVVAGPVPDDIEIDSRDVMDGLVVGDGTVKKQWTDSLMALVIGEDDECYFSAEIEDLIIRNVDGLDWEVDTSLTPSDMGYTYEREVPDRFYYGSASKKAGFLRGLFSANGCAHKKYNRVSLKSASKQLIFDVQDMLSSLGIRSYYTTNKPSKIEFRNGEYTTRPSYDLNISTDRGKFCDLIGFIHPHKQEILEKISKTPTRDGRKTHDIVDVVSLGEEPVYDITVDADEHTYWTGGLLVSNCGEEPLAAGESCCLGSMVLPSFVRDGGFDYDGFESSVKLATRFLDNVLTMNGHPLEETQGRCDELRRVGLGVMGDADMLSRMRLPYDSDDAHGLRNRVAITMRDATVEASESLALEKGEFPLWAESDLQTPRRNIHTTTIPPTGTTSMVADVSSGIEPVYALAMQRRVGGEYSFRLHPEFERYIEENRQDLLNMDNVKYETVIGIDANDNDIVGSVEIPGFVKPILENRGSIQGLDEYFDKDEQEIFKTAHDIDYTGHIDAQSVWQVSLDGGDGLKPHSSISKTINMRNSATVDDVLDAYNQAHKKNLKAVSLYRDGSKSGQVLSAGSSDAGTDVADDSSDDEVVHPKDRPQVLSGETRRVETPLGTAYVTVNSANGRPFEAFVALGKAGGAAQADAEAMGRLISLVLRNGGSIDDVAQQLRGIRSDRTIGFGQNKVASVPDAIGKALSEYGNVDTNGNKEDLNAECSNCGGTMVFSEGCETCVSCGSSKCQ